MLLGVSSSKQAMLVSKKLQFSLNYRSRNSVSEVFSGVLTRGYTNPAGIPGSGVGKGGGAGGSVRESGGGLGKYGAAQEEGYFHHKQREQLEKIKKQLKEGRDIGLSQKPNP